MKLKKINNKGFSLVEILAVVVILGIVSTIGIVSVTKLIENSKKHYYESQQNNLVLAARAYVSDHKEVQPRNIGEKKKVYLKDLYETNYLKDEIVDKNKGKCYTEDKKDASGKVVEKASYVNVIKTTNNDYAYKGYLYCESCGQDGNCEEETGLDLDNKPLVVITLPGNKDANLFEESSTIDLKYQAKGNNATVTSYSYKIFVNGKLIFNSGTKINGKKQELIIKEPIYNYVPGKVKVTATITNSEGETKSYSKTQDYSDSAAPSCGAIKYDGNYPLDAYKSGQSKTCGTTGYLWSNKTRHVWVVCNDFKGIGCSQPEFSKYLDTEGAKDEVIIKDNNDNTDPKCSVMKCIDRTTPKITVKIFKSDKNGNKTGGATKTFTVDSQPAIKTYTKNETYSKWLNKEDYQNGVIVEVTVTDVAVIATAKSDIKTFSWYQNTNNQRENNIGATNSRVNINNNITTTTYTQSQRITNDGVRKQVIKVTDKAGNSTTYNLILKIDRTPPNIPTTNLKKWKNNNTQPTNATGLSNYTNNTWYSGKVFTYPSGSTDSPNISGFKEYQYTTTGKTENKSDKVATNRNVEAQGVSYIKWRACDNAGNCSNYNTNSTIKLDRTKPNCSIKKTNTYTTTGVTLTTTCSDEHSGISVCEKVHNNVKSSKEYTVKDLANNTNTCSKSVYSKQRRTCAQCGSCPSAGCKSPVYSTSYYISYWSSTGLCDKGDKSVARHLCNISDLADSNSQCCEHKKQTGCNAYYSSCSSCGCDKWNSWYDTNSTSCDSNGTSSQCRTRYY